MLYDVLGSIAKLIKAAVRQFRGREFVFSVCHIDCGVIWSWNNFYGYFPSTSTSCLILLPQILYAQFRNTSISSLYVRFFCLCDKVYYKQEIWFLLYFLSQIVTWQFIGLKLTMYCYNDNNWPLGNGPFWCCLGQLKFPPIINIVS